MVDETQQALVVRRALNGDLGRLQMWFTQEVLDIYRSRPGTKVIRTDTAGRIRASTWSLDFGIVDEERLVHATIDDLRQRLPESEHEHWAQHVHGPAASRNFLMMRFGGGACIDDGEIREWS